MLFKVSTGSQNDLTVIKAIKQKAIKAIILYEWPLKSKNIMMLHFHDRQNNYKPRLFHWNQKAYNCNFHGYTRGKKIIYVQLKTYHFNHLYVYNSVALTTFMMLCTHHHYLFPEVFCTPNKTLYSLSNSSSFLTLEPLNSSEPLYSRGTQKDLHS